MGARGMLIHLRQKYDMRVPKVVEADSVRRHKGKRFKCKQYWTTGLNDIWCFDQHDKWLHFRLFLHLGLITRAVGGVPLVTQSDTDSENFGIANCHTEHRWMRNRINIKPEIFWAVLQHDWTLGFEDILDHGRLKGVYDPNEPLEKLVFLWVMVPWLQGDLDDWVRQFNTSPRHADKNKVLPQGIPDVITAKPMRYNTIDFKNMPQVPDMQEELATRSTAKAEEVALLASLCNLRHSAEAPEINGMCYLGGLPDPPALGGPPPAAGSSTTTHSRENDGDMQELTLASDDLRHSAELTDSEDD
ncbi:hypothetical protein FKP32DRAFT_1604643 [Trametes sanguinea]|nr:hypothetical protein FKP32DRAFT_1604643 [Trametes sanguinea]